MAIPKAMVHMYQSGHTLSHQNPPSGAGSFACFKAWAQEDGNVFDAPFVDLKRALNKLLKKKKKQGEEQGESTKGASQLSSGKKGNCHAAVKVDLLEILD